MADKLSNSDHNAGQTLLEVSPAALQPYRGALRWTTIQPLRLTTGSGEAIPAVLLNVGASGLLAVVDARFSPWLPPPCGTRINGEFYLDEIEIKQGVLEVVWTEKQTTGQILLGCTFIAMPSGIARAIRDKVTAHAARQCQLRPEIAASPRRPQTARSGILKNGRSFEGEIRVAV